MKMTIPKQGIEEGELFGLGPQVTYGDRWVKERGEFSLDTNGDNIFLYCKDSLNRIRFLSGFSNFGGWSSELESSYATNSSALPDSLVNSTITLPHMNNYHYNGERDTRISLLRQNIWNANLWTGSDLTRYEMGEVRKDDSAGVSISSVGSLGTALIVGAFASWVSFC